MAPSGTSQFVKNGQQISVPAGSAAIAAGSLLTIGGLGTEAWPTATLDYAANASAGTLLAVTGVAAYALPGSARQPVARDRLGNIYQACTNGSGQLVMYKRGPFGTSPVSAVLDSGATSVNTAILFQLQSGNFCCVYARSGGSLRFVVFDAMLTVIAGPSVIAAERAATDVVYHAAVPLAAGGFAVAYQTSAGTSINLITYTNAGVIALSATSVQTLAGGAAQEYLRLVQLSNGNLAIAYRGTMTAGGNAGTSVNVVTTAGVAVSGPTSVDLTSSLGLLELDALSSGGFAVAVMNGTNMVCSVFNNAGAAQGVQFSVANTLAATTYPQMKLANDGVRFWLAYFTSAGNGLYVLGLTTAGAIYASASGLGSGTLSASTFALDAEVVNGLLVALAASSATAGQFWMTVGLPDASMSVSAPYVRTVPTAIGAAAATTGARWPRVLSAGSGFFRGTSPPANQPTNPAAAADFTVVLSYDQTNVAGTFVAVVKTEPTAIIGIAMADVGANNQGLPLFVNPGQGEYTTVAVGGTSGIQFNHLSNVLGGTSGTLYTNGAALTGIATGGSGGSGTPNTAHGSQFYDTVGNYVFTTPLGTTVDTQYTIQIGAPPGGGGGSGGGSVSAGGGGGGGYAEIVVTGFSAGANFDIVIGAPGAAGAGGGGGAGGTGGTGGTTSVDTGVDVITCTGGEGGVYNGPGGAGGTATGGDINFSGTPGGQAYSAGGSYFSGMGGLTPYANLQGGFGGSAGGPGQVGSGPGFVIIRW